MSIKVVALTTLIGLSIAACEPAVQACAVAPKITTYQRILEAFKAQPASDEVMIYTGEKIKRLQVTTAVRKAFAGAIHPKIVKIEGSRDWRIKWVSQGSDLPALLRVR